MAGGTPRAAAKPPVSFKSVGTAATAAMRWRSAALGALGPVESRLHDACSIIERRTMARWVWGPGACWGSWAAGDGRVRMRGSSAGQVALMHPMRCQSLYSALAAGCSPMAGPCCGACSRQWSCRWVGGCGVGRGLHARRGAGCTGSAGGNLSMVSPNRVAPTAGPVVAQEACLRDVVVLFRRKVKKVGGHPLAQRTFHCPAFLPGCLPGWLQAAVGASVASSCCTPACALMPAAPCPPPSPLPPRARPPPRPGGSGCCARRTPAWRRTTSTCANSAQSH